MRLWLSLSKCFWVVNYNCSNFIALVSYRVLCRVLWCLRTPATYFESIGSNQFFRYFWKIGKGINRAIVTFVFRFTFLKNWSNISKLQNIMKIPTFFTIIENFCESVTAYMNRVGHDFKWNVFKYTGFTFR